MSEAEKDEYKDAAQFLAVRAHEVEDIAAGVKYGSEVFPNDIRNAIRSKAAKMKILADEMFTLANKYEKKAEKAKED